MSDDSPTFMADVAARVVAWHNRHPLARRITRKDVQGIGAVELPYARDGQRPWHAVAPRQGMMALLFARRPKRRQWPVFSEALVPELGRDRIDRFARRHGSEQRPGPDDLPQRVAAFDPDLLAPPGPAPEYPPERFNHFLLSAVIDVGPQRPRLMLSTGPRPAVLGSRLWSLPRLAGLGGAALLALVIGAAGLWLKAMQPRGATAAGPASAPTSAASVKASPPASAAGLAAPAATAPSASSTAGSTSASVAAPAAAVASAAPAIAAPSSAAPAPTPTPTPTPTPAPAPTTAQAPPTAAAPPAPTRAAASVPAAASAAMAARPEPGASAAASASGAGLPMTHERPGPPRMRRASEPLVPRLRPDLAAAARAEAERSGLAASMPPRPERGASAAGTAASAVAPGLQGPGAGTPPLPGAVGPRGSAPTAGATAATTPGVPASASAVPARFYALVTRPVRSKAEAEAVMRRLRVETDRINHPTASQTALLQAADGWRVTWWPFTGPRQADNARAALARRIELEVIEF